MRCYAIMLIVRTHTHTHPTECSTTATKLVDGVSSQKFYKLSVVPYRPLQTVASPGSSATGAQNYMKLYCCT